jgi:ATP-dependent DNA helicase RecG
MDLTALLTRTEGKTLEFKRDLSSPDRVIRTIVAFANTAGGTILIGVEDKTRNVVGVSDPLMEEERMANLIAHLISPQLVPEIEILPWRKTHLLAVHVYPAWSAPHYLAKLGPESGVFVRVGSSNRQADPAIIAELKRNAGVVSYDEYPVPELNTDSLDFALASSLFVDVRKITRRDLQTLKLTCSHRGRIAPTVGGMLLIGHDRFGRFPDAYMKVARFEGTTRNRILDMQEIRVPLPRVVDEAVAFVEKHTSRAAVFGTVRRVDRWPIPLEALREIVINSVIHADYSQIGGPLRLALYDDRLEVENPGLLPAGVTVEDMRQGISKPRNRVIARFFQELNMVEQWGSGVRRMTDACLAAGLREPEFEEIATHFRVTIRAATSVLSGRRGEASASTKRIDARDSTALAFLAEHSGTGGVSTSEVAKHLGVTSRTARTLLAGLIARNLAVAVGASANDPQRRYFRAGDEPQSVPDL